MADVFHTWLDCDLLTRVGSELDQGGDAGFFEKGDFVAFWHMLRCIRSYPGRADSSKELANVTDQEGENG